MIIGSIVEVGSGDVPGDNGRNGAALMHFYNWDDAATWALEQSRNSPVATSNVVCLCTIINCTTGEKRWWYSGVEYTG